jgi:hypothetical protein
MVLVAVLVAGLVTQRWLTAKRDLLDARHTLEQVPAALVEGEVDEAESLIRSAEADLRRARARFDAAPMRALALVPVVGSPNRAIEDAAGAGLEVVAAAEDLRKASISFGPTTLAATTAGDLTQAREAMSEAMPMIASAQTRLEAARRSLAGPSGALLPPISSAARDMDAEVVEMSSRLARARDGLNVAVDLLSDGHKTRVLLVAQNSLELRATGGFIGSFAVIEIDGPKVALVDYRASEDLPPPNPRLETPSRLRVATRGPWILGNAGWWPDFPTSAQTMRTMFQHQGGGQVDVVVGMTEHVMASLLEVFEPVTIEGYAPVVAEGFDQRVLYEVELKKPLDNPRKKFLVQLSQELFDRLFDLPAESFPAVIRKLDAEVDRGHVQAWFADPAQQSRLEGTRISGVLPKADRDFLMIVDTNMTASKANADLTRSATYRVRRDGRGRLLASLTIEYRNDGRPSEINPYYNGYVRVYAPLGARLLNPDDPMPRDEGRAPDGPYRVFSRDVVVRPRGEATVTFDYFLPDSVAPGGHYRLDWPRQVGTEKDAHFAVAGTSAAQAEGTDGALSLEATLRRNRVAEFLRTRRLVRPLLE